MTLTFTHLATELLINYLQATDDIYALNGEEHTLLALLSPAKLQFKLLVFYRSICRSILLPGSNQMMFLIFCCYKCNPSNINSSKPQELDEKIPAEDGDGEGEINGTTAGALA